MPRTARTTQRLLPRFMGGSTLFNGTTSTIVVPHNANQLLTTGFTLSAWIKPKTGGEGGLGRIIDKSTGGSGAGGFVVQMANTGIITTQVNGGTARTSSSVKFNRWTHVTISVGADATVTYYINGVLSGTPGATGALSGITATSYLTIGNRSGATDRTFDGNLAEVKIYNQALTADQALSLYTTGSVPGVNPVDSYPLDDQPSTYVDSIGGANGTGTNTTYSQDVPIQERVARDEDAQASLWFDGVDDKITIPNASQIRFDANPFSVAVKMKIRTKGSWRVINKWDTKGWLIDTGAGGVRFRVYDGTNGRDFQPSCVLKANEWITIVATCSIANNRMRLYVNGQLIGEADVNSLSSVATAADKDIEVGTLASSQWLPGLMKSIHLWNRELTHDEVKSLVFGNIIPRSGLVDERILNECAGTVAYDTSGNGNHGTITGATWSSDVPSKKRKVIGGNLVKNGDISYIPVVNVAQTTNARWIDGTATGSTNNDYANLFGFFATNRRGTATYTVNFDTEVTYRGKPSIKIEVTAQSGCEVSVRKTSNVLTGWSASAIGYIPIKPSTQYIARIAIKTVGVPDGGANTNVNVSVAQIGANKTSYITQAVPINNLFGTQDFTEYELTFTSNVNARFADFIFEIRDTTGVAYFSDIQLIEVGAARLPVT